MTDWHKEWRKLALMVGVFLTCFYLPTGLARCDHAVLEDEAVVIDCHDVLRRVGPLLRFADCDELLVVAQSVGGRR